MNLKKFIIAVGAFTAVLSTVAFAQSNIKVYVDNTEIKFDNAPSLIEGRVMVPVRAVFEKAGATVSWNEETRVTTLTKDDYEVTIKEGDPFLIKNGKPICLDVPASIIEDRLAIPVRAISESFGCLVEWEQEVQLISISVPDRL